MCKELILYQITDSAETKHRFCLQKPLNGAAEGDEYAFFEGATSYVYKAKDTSGRAVLIKKFHHGTGEREHKIISLLIERLREDYGANYLPQDKFLAVERDRDGNVIAHYQVFLGWETCSLLPEGATEPSVPSVLWQFTDLITVVQALHRCGYFHWDLKPGNICGLRTVSRCDLFPIDFGSAKPIEESVARFLDGKQGTASTKWWYPQSDKELLKRSAEKIESPRDRASFLRKHLISLECAAAARILVSMLSGETRNFPSEKTQIEQMLSHLRLEEQPLEKIAPASFDALVAFFEKAFDPDVQNRYLSCEQMIADLRDIGWSLSRDNCSRSIRARKLAMRNALMCEIPSAEQGLIWERCQRIEEDILPRVRIGESETSLSELLDLAEGNLYLIGRGGAGKSSLLIYHYDKSLRDARNDRICYYFSLSEKDVGALTRDLATVAFFDGARTQIFLDALDESKIVRHAQNEEDQRQKLSDFYGLLAQYRDKCSFVITSRTDCCNDSTRAFTVGNVLPLDEALVSDKLAEHNIDLHERNPRLRQLLQSPMMLTLYRFLLSQKTREQLSDLERIDNETVLIYEYLKALYETKKSLYGHIKWTKIERDMAKIGGLIGKRLDEEESRELAEDFSTCLNAFSSIVSLTKIAIDAFEFGASHELFEQFFVAFSTAHHIRACGEYAEKGNRRKFDDACEFFNTRDWMTGSHVKVFESLKMVGELLKYNTPDMLSLLERVCLYAANQKRDRNLSSSNEMGMSRYDILISDCYWIAISILPIYEAIDFVDRIPLEHILSDRVATYMGEFLYIPNTVMTLFTVGYVYDSVPEFSYFPPEFPNLKQIQSQNPRFQVLDDRFLIDAENPYNQALLLGLGAEEMIVPDAVRKISSCAFSGNDMLKKVILPRGIREIEMFAFRNCRNLTEVFLSDTVKLIGPYAFSGTALKEITMPGVRVITSGSFAETNLEAISMPEVQDIGGFAFAQCRSLRHCSMPMVKTIKALAFSDCTSLQSIVLSKRVERIKLGAFLRCDNLKEIIFLGTQEEWISLFIRSHGKEWGIDHPVTVRCEDGDLVQPFTWLGSFRPKIVE